VAASGLAPLDFLLTAMRNEELDLDKRIDAAKAAAPYVHPRLNATTLAGDPKRPPKFILSWETSTTPPVTSEKS
jgi:hypothetical protein